MANKTVSKSAPSTASSWWKERGKIIPKKVVTAKHRAKKKVKTMKAAKAETGFTYYCEVCGCEMVCASDSSGVIVCC